MPALCYSLSRLAAHPEREQQQHESDQREQAEIEEQCRAHERCEPRRAIGAAQLAIPVERHIEHREKNRELAADRQVNTSPHDEQHQNDRTRAIYENTTTKGE